MSTAILDFTRGRMARTLAVLIACAALVIIALGAAHPVLAQAAAPAATGAPAAPAVAATAESPTPVAALPATGPAPAPAPSVAAVPSTSPTAAAAPGGSSAYTPMTPVEGVGMPIPGGLNVQDQFSPTGSFAHTFHNAMIWVMVAICVFVLALLLYVMVKFRAKANPVPSRTTHNTLLEVVWTLLPVAVLLAIAIPSITLLSQQYRSPPKNAITVKITGNQWYWSYAFPDHGDFAFDSYMLNVPNQPKVNPQQRDVGTQPYDGPALLEVDNRLVLPVGVPIRMQITAADVIHSFAVPALWFKLDAVPGRLNERMMTIEKPGVYYGQCSELCGVKHGYMPIAVEAVPMNQWRAWVIAQGGSFKDPNAPSAAPAAAAVKVPASAQPGATASPPATPAATQSAAPAASPSAVAPATPTPAA